jgi:DnaJ family protein C protein 2
VLKHHPDKKATIAGETNDDAFFKCIQKAMDVLTNPERRRQFDSVDPYYLSLEEDDPTAAQMKGKDSNAFFKAFGPVFEREARFSKVKPVPLLGSVDAPKEEVEGFYNFWYNFDSWRSFEYLDKEINEGSDKYEHIHRSQVSRRLTIDLSVGTTSGTRKRRIKRRELAEEGKT